MQNRITASYIKIGQAMIHFAEIQAVIKCSLHLFPGHSLQLLMGTSRKNIAMFTSLVTFISNVPLKRKILLHNYLSEAPQALPQADADASAGLSDAPHALPQADAGLSDAPHAAGVSAGLSEAPHAVPHEAAAATSVSLFHPDKFESAIIHILLGKKIFTDFYITVNAL
jgi:hypothetical protein